MAEDRKPHQGLPEGHAYSAYVDRDSTLWVGSVKSSGVFRRPREQDHFQKRWMTLFQYTPATARSIAGTIWITDPQLVSGNGGVIARHSDVSPTGNGVALFRCKGAYESQPPRRRGLWLVPPGTAETRVKFQDQKDGLSATPCCYLRGPRGTTYVGWARSGTHASLQMFTPRRVSWLTDLPLVIAVA